MELGNDPQQLHQIIQEKDAKIRELEGALHSQTDHIRRLETDLYNSSNLFQEKERRLMMELENARLQVQLAQQGRSSSMNYPPPGQPQPGPPPGQQPPGPQPNQQPGAGIYVQQGYPPPNPTQGPTPPQSGYPPSSSTSFMGPPPTQTPQGYPPSSSPSVLPGYNQNASQINFNQSQQQYPPPQTSQPSLPQVNSAQSSSSASLQKQSSSQPSSQPSSGPRRCNNLGSSFRNGSKIHLNSIHTSHNVRITRFTSTLEAMGGDRDMAKFMIDKVGADRVKFRSVGHPNKFLRISSPTIFDSEGSGGLDCEFWVVEHGRYGGADEVYSFESTKYPGSFMAFQKNGKPGHLISPDLPISTQFRLRIAAS
mmetsp:Transcript_37059/g.51123  ORF Transcript_37059/g.51123 Transcript_37059/m.51123 type:complete len:366 (+) Transcript_37059:53-1150(+)